MGRGAVDALGPRRARADPSPTGGACSGGELGGGRRGGQDPSDLRHPASAGKALRARGTLTGMRRAACALAVSILVLVCARCSPFESDAPPAAVDGGPGGSADGGSSADSAPDARAVDSGLKDCQVFEQDFEKPAAKPWTGAIEPTGEQKHLGANAGKYVGNAAKSATLDVSGDYTHVDVEYWIWLRSVSDYAEVGCNVNLDSGAVGSASIFVSRNATQLVFTGELPDESSVGSAYVDLPQAWTKVSLSLDLEGGKLSYAASDGKTTFQSDKQAPPGFVPSSVSVKGGIVFVKGGATADLYLDDAKVRVCRR